MTTLRNAIVAAVVLAGTAWAGAHAESMTNYWEITTNGYEILRGGWYEVRVGLELTNTATWSTSQWPVFESMVNPALECTSLHYTVETCVETQEILMRAATLTEQWRCHESLTYAYCVGGTNHSGRSMVMRLGDWYEIATVTNVYALLEWRGETRRVLLEESNGL